MTSLRDGLRRISGELTDAGASYVLVGGLAVSVRVEPRFTRDIDLVVAVPADEEAERLVRSLTETGWQIRTVLEHEAVGRLATVRLNLPPGEEPTVAVDLLFASSGIEDELAAAADVLEVLPGTTVPVADVAGLIVLKLLATAPSRPQDEVDLVGLLEVATDDDLRAAHRLALDVTARGYHRDRDLVAELERRRRAQA